MNNKHIKKSHKNKQINIKSIKNNQTNQTKPNHILLRVKEKRNGLTTHTAAASRCGVVRSYSLPAGFNAAAFQLVLKAMYHSPSFERVSRVCHSR